MSRRTEDTGFVCINCGASASRHPAGSYRNHCPHCLFSVHVDVVPGDRAADCHGPMAPVALDYSGKKGYVVVHQCGRCGRRDRNKVAPDDRIDRLTALFAPVPNP